MEIELQKEADGVVAIVRGRVDTISAPAFEKGLAEVLEMAPKLLIFDLSEMDYISSAGLRVFLVAAKALKGKSGEVRLAASQAPVKKVFQVSGVLSLFKHFDTKDAAFATP
jgi:anti-anti-sigma factor